MMPFPLNRNSNKDNRRNYNANRQNPNNKKGSSDNRSYTSNNNNVRCRRADKKRKERAYTSMATIDNNNVNKNVF